MYNNLSKCLNNCILLYVIKVPYVYPAQALCFKQQLCIPLTCIILYSHIYSHHYLLYGVFDLYLYVFTYFKCINISVYNFIYAPVKLGFEPGKNVFAIVYVRASANVRVFYRTCHCRVDIPPKKMTKTNL